MSAGNCRRCLCHDMFVSFGRQQTRFPRFPRFPKHEDTASSGSGAKTQLFLTDSGYQLINAECSIVQLPTEVLHSILDKAVQDRSWSHGMYQVSLVCRVFHSYMEKSCFSHISLAKENASYEDEEHGLAPACSRVRNLYSLLTTDPGLGQFCRSLSIKLPLLKSANEPIQSLTWADYEVASDLLKSLPNVRKLEIHNGFAQDLTVPFLTEALRGLTSLESVKFACGWLTRKTTGESHLALMNVWECIQSLSLDQLCVQGVRPKTGGGIWQIPEVSNSAYPLTAQILTSFIAEGSQHIPRCNHRDVKLR